MNDDTTKSPNEITLDRAYEEALSGLTTNQPLPDWMRKMLGIAEQPKPDPLKGKKLNHLRRVK